jgi:hypothetical protein
MDLPFFIFLGGLDMNADLRRHYLATSVYTEPGPFRTYFRTLPDDIAALGRLVCDQVVHPSILQFPAAQLEPYFGPLASYPVERMKNEDELFVTAAAMTAELFRLDERGFTDKRALPQRLAVSCRHAAVLMASICKAKGVPCRARAGFIDFLHNGSNCGDHWINQVWSDQEDRWVNVDADGYYEYERRFGFSQFDLPDDKFNFAAQTWLGLRQGQWEANHFEFQDGQGTYGLKAAIIYLFTDFHALMNNELFYTFRPAYTYNRFERLTEADLAEMDALATDMLDPDRNFGKLKETWDAHNRFRVLASPFNPVF